MYWSIVFAVVALLSAPFALATAGGTAVAAASVGVVFAILAIGSAAGAMLARLR